jgi:hypothetical protein
MQAAEIIKALEAIHDPSQWGFFDELRIGTGYTKDSEQRLDAWAIHYYPSKRNVVRAFEVKISRSDFLSEMKKPLKRRPGLRLSNEFYFVAPQGLLKIEEIPPECGLMEVKEDGSIITKISAPYRDTFPPTWLFMAAIARRVDKGRASEAALRLRAQMTIRISENATANCLERHLFKWKSHNVGSRDVPDKIVAALEDLKREVGEFIKANMERELA